MAINNNNSTSRSQLQTIINNPYAIRQEIQRFESVHPSIYAIYDLIELVPDIQVATQIREHIVNIEGETQKKYLTSWADEKMKEKKIALGTILN